MKKEKNPAVVTFRLVEHFVEQSIQVLLSEVSGEVAMGHGLYLGQIESLA